VLRRARFPRADTPAAFGLTSRQFWSEIGDALESGALEDGRKRILDAALDIFPHNAVFQRAALALRHAGGGERAGLLVLVVGAGTVDPAADPAAGGGGRGVSPIRADLESKLVRDAEQPGRLTVELRTAATIDDLDAAMLALRPDILHLICHGDGENLVFPDACGEPQPVPAGQIAKLLAAYQRHARVRLTGIVLNACFSAQMAALFAPVAETVVAHEGRLDDGCAPVFAGQLYRTLREVPSLGGAALVAAEAIATNGSGCGDIRDGLVVLPIPDPPDGP
jgi:Effector-associated domain 1